MKHFSQSNPIVEFSVRCPQDGTQKKALIKSVYHNGKMIPGIAECRGDPGSQLCEMCRHCMTSIFFHDQEPEDFFQEPLDPRQSFLWKSL